jgi:hypothetical protein
MLSVITTAWDILENLFFSRRKNDPNSSLESDGEEDENHEEDNDEEDWSRLIRLSADIAQEFDDFVAELAGLETIIGEIEYHFGNIVKKGDLDKELKLLEKAYRGKKRYWRTRAEESIGMLFAINNYQEAAQAVQDAAKALGLTGSFLVVDRILNSVETGFRSLPLNQVSR